MIHDDNMSNLYSNGYEKFNSEIENLANFEITPKQAKEFLYPYIEKIINLSKEEKFHIFKEWKHGNSLELTLKHHSNNEQFNHKLSWEESVCMTFLLFIYH